MITIRGCDLREGGGGGGGGGEDLRASLPFLFQYGYLIALSCV